MKTCNIGSLGLFEPGATLTSNLILKESMLEGRCLYSGTADGRHLKRGKEPKQYTTFFVRGHSPKRWGGRIPFSFGFYTGVCSGNSNHTPRGTLLGICFVL